MLLRRLVALTIIVAGAATVAASDAAIVRFSAVSNDRICAVRQVLGIPTDADVLLFGSSRVRRDLSAEVMVEASKGQIDTVYNVGRPNVGTVRHIAMLSDLLERGVRPTIVVAEVRTEDFNKNVAGAELPLATTPDAPFLRWRDVPRAAADWEMPYRPPLAVEGNIALDKLDNSLELMLDGTVLKVLTAPEGPVPTVCFPKGFDLTTQAGEKAKADLLANVLKKNPDQFETARDAGVQFASYKARVQLQYVKALRELSERYGFKLLLTRLPGYTQQPFSPRIKAMIEKVMPEFRFPPDELYRLDATFFIDTHHFGPSGRLLMSTWFSQLVASEAAGQ